MELGKVFQQTQKPAEEKKLEVVASAESIKDGWLANLIIFGKTFYSNKKNNRGRDVGIPDALRKALNYAGKNGFVASMPELIAAKLKVDKSHDFWQNWWYAAHTEENIGLDKKGLHGKKNNPVLVVVHGGGILTPDRIQQAYDEGLTERSAAKYTTPEFDDLLEGKLPSGKSVKLYTLEDIKKGISQPFGRYGVVMDYETAQSTKSGIHSKKEFIDNPLVIARAGSIENLEEYFEKAKHPGEIIGNWHPFKSRNQNQAQGRLLFIYSDGGLSGDGGLVNFGRFVGVAPEIHNTQKWD